MNDREVRSAAAEFRVDGDGETPRRIVGYAAKFGVRSVDLGWFTEEIAPGAFSDVLAEGQDVRALVDHDPPRILGRTTAGTLRLSEDEVGLLMEIDVPNTTVGSDLVESVRRGDITGASFSFRTKDDEWQTKDGKNHRVLKKVMTLYDVGPVTFPAYTDTTVAVRSLRGIEMESDTMPRARQKQAESLR